MGTIAGIIASFAASHLGGMSIGGLLAQNGWLGFASEAGKVLIARRKKRRAEKAQADYQNWLNLENPESDE